MPADIGLFLEPVRSDPPSGAELRNDPRFHAIERRMEPASKESRARQNGGGATPADWDAVLSDAAELATQGRDLRLLVIVARAWANAEGFAGLARGLTLLGDTVERYWDSVHPLLRDRPDPRDAALRRINALRQIENDDDGLLGDLELNVVLTARGIGGITGGDLAAGSMTTHQVLSEAPSGLAQAERDALAAAHADRVNRVRAAARAAAAEDPEHIASLARDIDAARGALGRLEGRLAGALGLGDGQGVRLAALGALLDRAHATVAEAAAHAAAHAEADGGTVSETSQEAAPAAEPVTPGAAAAGAGARAAAAPGAIASREDVVRSLDGIIAFYERTEPASPIPHLVRRVRRMVPMDFMQLMAELAPSGIKEFRSAAGVADDKGK